MKSFVAVTLSLSILVLSGCVTTQYNVNPVVDKNNRIVFQNGLESLLSEKANVVALGSKNPTIQSNTRQSFTVAIQNRTDEEVIFSEKDVSVSYTSLSSKETVLHVYSYDELVAEEKKRQAWAALATGLAAVGNSMAAANAGYSNTYGTYSGNTYSSYGGSYSTFGNYSATTYNHGAALAAQNAANAENNANFARLAQQGKANLESLSSTILKKQTVFPSQWYGGVIQINMPRFEESGNLNFEVKAGNEIHEINFQVEVIK